MPPTPQQTTLTESGSGPKPISRQPTVGGKEGTQIEEQDEGGIAEDKTSADESAEGILRV